MAPSRPLVTRAILKDIEVKGVVGDGKHKLRSSYSVRAYIADREVAKSSCRLSSSVLKWKWDANRDILYEPSSTMRIVIHRSFSPDMSLLDAFVGQYEGKVVDLLENNAILDLKDKKGVSVSMKMKMSLSPQPDLDDYIRDFMNKVNVDIARLPSDETLPRAVLAIGQVLKLTKSIMEKLSQAHPILSASWSVFSVLYEAVQKTILQDDSVRELADTLRELLGIADAVPDLLVIPNTTDVIREISRHSLAVASLIHEYVNSHFAGRMLQLNILNSLESRIDNCQKSCAFLKEKFDTRLHVNTNAQVNKIMDKILENEIRIWLAPPDFHQNRQEAYGKRQDNTCSWFLTGERFLRWCEDPGFIWVMGKSGCGKSVLCSSIIDALPDSSSTIGISHFFFDARDGQTELQLHHKLIRSLVSQLSDSRHGGISPELAELYRKCGSQQPLTEQLQAVLRGIFNSFSQVYIVVDALDECSNRKDTLAWINGLVVDSHRKTTNLHILVTSRPERDIEDVFLMLDPLPTDVAKTVANEDIIQYIERKIATNFEKFDEATREQITSGLRERAEGSFRWVSLQLEQLESCPSDYEILEKMKHLPKDLDEIYARILKAIDGLYLNDTVTILEWLCFAQRPMNVPELAETVSVDFKADDGPIFNAKKRYKNPRDILLRCSSLVTESEGYLKLSHFSVKEYLLSHRIDRSFRINESAAHTKISQTSVAYLLQFSSFEPLSLALSPLAQYAARFWINHVTSASMVPISETLILRLFTSESAALTNWVRIHNIDHWNPQNLSMGKDKVCSPLYYASLAGLHGISKQLLENGADVNWRGGRYDSALQAASIDGNEAVVRLLLEKGADVNFQGEEYGSALRVVSFKGHLEIAKLLLDKGADVNSRGSRYGSALQEASSSGHAKIVKLLLDNGADVDFQGGEYGSSLRVASFKGHLEIAKLLLEEGADIDLQGWEYGSALQAASAKGHLDIAKLLLDKGADVNLKGGKYDSALQAASIEGQLEIVKLLLDKGADVNCLGAEYGSALQAASAKGHLDIAKLLLEKGADVNLKGGKYGSTLQAACLEGHLEIVNLLLEKDVDVNLQGGWYDSPLQAASVKGHLEIAKLLLEKGADVNLQGGEYGSALQAASVKGHLDIAKLLLAKDADVNLQGGMYGNALQMASVKGHLEISKLLLERGADADLQGWEYGSALQAASYRRKAKAVKLLLDAGAEVHAQGEWYGKAL